MGQRVRFLNICAIFMPAEVKKTSANGGQFSQDFFTSAK